jgi:hypothetical protein
MRYLSTKLYCGAKKQEFADSALHKFIGIEPAGALSGKNSKHNETTLIQNER